jgi:Tol biopolymer transport system component
MHRLALIAVLGGVAFGLSPVGHARPAKPALVDCTCYDIVRVARGRVPSTVFKNTGQNLFDVSRDRRRIAYAGAHGRLYVARLDGSKRRLLERRRARWAVFAPNGQFVAYGADGCRLCIARIDGRSRRRFAVGGARGPVAWSPDSRRLAFVVSRASASVDRGVLTVARLNGTGVTRLVWGRHFNGRTNIGVKMAWSPHGGRLAYLSGARTRIHVLRLRDHRQLAIVRGRAPVWSPDGRLLAFSTGFRVAVMRFDGKHRHVLDPLSVDPYGSGVSWSPGGRWIAFSRYSKQERYQLTIATNDGRRHRVLRTESHEVEIGPTYWAAHGGTIFYTAYHPRAVTQAGSRPRP